MRPIILQRSNAAMAAAAISMSLLATGWLPQAHAAGPTTVNCNPGAAGETPPKECNKGGGADTDPSANAIARLTGLQAPALLPDDQASFSVTPLGAKANAACPLLLKTGPLNSPGTTWAQLAVPAGKIGSAITVAKPSQQVSAFEVRVSASDPAKCSGGATAVVQMKKAAAQIKLSEIVTPTNPTNPVKPAIAIKLPSAVSAGTIQVAGQFVALPADVKVGQLKVAGNFAYLPADVKVGQLKVTGNFAYLPAQVKAGQLKVTGNL